MKYVCGKIGKYFHTPTKLSKNIIYLLFIIYYYYLLFIIYYYMLFPAFDDKMLKLVIFGVPQKVPQKVKKVPQKVPQWGTRGTPIGVPQVFSLPRGRSWCGCSVIYKMATITIISNSIINAIDATILYIGRNTFLCF